MTNIFGNMESYVSPAKTVSQYSKPETIKVSETLPAANVNTEDSVELSSKKEKKGIVKSVKTLIANVKKFFASTGTYLKGAVKGAFSGAVIGSVIYTVGSVANHFKQKAGQNTNPKVKVALAAVGFAAGLGANLWKASLDASEKRSEIEHRYIGHTK